MLITYLDSQGLINLSTDKYQLQSFKKLNYGRVGVVPMSELVMPFLAKAADINSIERTPMKLYDSTLLSRFKTTQLMKRLHYGSKYLMS